MINKNIFKNQTCINTRSFEPDFCTPVFISAYDEIHWYDFKNISDKEFINYTDNFFETYSQVFKIDRENNESETDYRNRLYVYSDFFEKTYHTSFLRPEKNSLGVNILPENLKLFNGRLNSVFCEAYKTVLLCDFEKILDKIKSFEDGDYFSSFKSVEEDFKNHFDILDGETGREYLTRLREYYFCMASQLFLYKNDSYIPVEYQLISNEKNKSSVIRYSTSDGMFDTSGDDKKDIYINGSVDKVKISDNENHYYSFSEIKANKLYSYLKNNYWSVYSKIFKKYQGETITEYKSRLDFYFAKFELAYKKYLKNLITVKS